MQRAPADTQFAAQIFHRERLIHALAHVVLGAGDHGMARGCGRGDAVAAVGRADQVHETAQHCLLEGIAHGLVFEHAGRARNRGHGGKQELAELVDALFQRLDDAYPAQLGFDVAMLDFRGIATKHVHGDGHGQHVESGRGAEVELLAVAQRNDVVGAHGPPAEIAGAFHGQGHTDGACAAADQSRLMNGQVGDFPEQLDAVEPDFHHTAFEAAGRQLLVDLVPFPQPAGVLVRVPGFETDQREFASPGAFVRCPMCNCLHLRTPPNRCSPFVHLNPSTV